MPGEVVVGEAPIDAGAKPMWMLTVANTADRPIQVGLALPLCRDQPAAGLRSPGGVGAAVGHPGRDLGPLRAGHRARGGPDPSARQAPGSRPARPGSADRSTASGAGVLMALLAASATPRLYGPTTGDRIRLADTDLWIEVTEDRSGPGDEAMSSGVARSFGSRWASRSATRADGAPDLVITGAVVLDHWGVVKCDVGVRDGRIVALGKAGNPDIIRRHPPGPGHRALDGDHLGQRVHPHRRRRRLPRPPHLPPDHRRGARRRRSPR